MLITFEGCEGAGKSTLIQAVNAYFSENGYQVIQTREPGGTPLGDQVRSLLLKVNPEVSISPKAELMLYMASRAQIIEEVISPALEAGKIVLCDRFNDSTIVYQGAARHLGESAVQQVCSFVCGDIHPDLTFYLDIDPVVGLQRTKKIAKGESAAGTMDRIESAGIAFHRNVREAYLRMAEQEPDRIVVLDASQAIEDVLNEALEVLDRCLKH